jgi:hypothetical protein
MYNKGDSVILYKVFSSFLTWTVEIKMILPYPKEHTVYVLSDNYGSYYWHVTEEEIYGIADK